MSIRVLDFILTHQADVCVFVFVFLTMIPTEICKNAEVFCSSFEWLNLINHNCSTITEEQGSSPKGFSSEQYVKQNTGSKNK